MKATQDDYMVTVRLSRRNLLALLHKLDMEGSARTLTRWCDELHVTVIAEEDEEHYGGRPFGTMHPQTEAFIADMKVRHEED
jgi:hypothetical protein